MSFSHKFRATQVEARDGIAAVMGRLHALGLPLHHAGDVEIVLAEAVNNVIEHAYEGRGAGDVEIHARLAPDHLAVHIFDSGAPLPAGKIPPPGQVVVNGPRQTLPEGGFGWPLIHELVSAVRYDRSDGCNVLSMRFLLDPAGGGGAGSTRGVP